MAGKGKFLKPDKNRLRIECLAARGRIAPDVAARAALLCCDQIVKLVPPLAIVAGYVSFKGELDLDSALRRLADTGHSLCLPVIEAADKPLFFRRWRVSDVLESGRYGIPIPLAGAPVFRPNVVLVPLVAFDRLGHRLGYGAGYYDRTIEELRKQDRSVMIIGVAYSQQEVEQVPVRRHDQALDVIVTDKEIIRIA